MSKINTTVAKVLPKVGDKMTAKMADKQKRDEPPRDPQGGLHEAARRRPHARALKAEARRPGCDPQPGSAVRRTPSSRRAFASRMRRRSRPRRS